MTTLSTQELTLGGQEPVTVLFISVRMIINTGSNNTYATFTVCQALC